LRAIEEVAIARQQAESRIQMGQQLFSGFNSVPVHTAPNLPWTYIDKLAVDFMKASNKLRRAELKTEESMPASLADNDSAISFPTLVPPQVVIMQDLHGSRGSSSGAILFAEHILRDVHWSVKGIQRREYTSEFITAYPSGIHRVERVAVPRYISGPGGIQQAFPEDPESGVDNR
jgi:hypothetical protein